MPLARCPHCRRLFITEREPTDLDGCPNCDAPLQRATLADADAALAEPPKAAQA
jgi:hypothetical protein